MATLQRQTAFTLPTLTNPRFLFECRMGRKKNRLPPFVFITKAMLKSDAYKELTNASRTAFLLLKAQCCKQDQQEVIFPYSHALDYMKTNTFSRSIKQLMDIGFIDKKQSGGLFRKVNIYSFSNRWETFIKPIPMAEYIRATEKGSVKKWNFEQTATEKGSVKS